MPTLPSLCTFGLLASLCAAILAAQAPEVTSPVPIDFSYAGYEGGGHPIPSVKAALLVRPSGGDDTAFIQSAIDRVASRPIAADGFRGAVLLAPGRFRIQGQLTLRSSGVVLLGSGTNSTTILADGIRRRTLIEAGAEHDPTLDTAIAVKDDTSAGTRTLHLASVDGLRVGDHIVVRRPSTQDWISAIGMSGLPGTFANQRLDWHPGSHDLIWDRTIAALEPATSSIEIDAPITTALEQKYGGGTIARVTGEPAPNHIGIEDLTLESAYARGRPNDEDHSWIAIMLDHVEDAWVRNVTARHFVSSAVRVNLRGRRITVQDCRNEAPVSEEGGYRRQSFLLYGQQVLVYHCSSEFGMNDFATGMLAGGPNVFLDCDAKNSLEASGAFEGWASGVLYESVHVPNARLQLLYDFSRAQGAGWTAANSLIWNSSALSIDAVGPPDARNFVVNSPQPLYESELLARTGVHLPKGPATPPTAAAATAIPEFHPSDVKAAAEPAPIYHQIEILNGRFVCDGEIVWGPSQTEAWWRGDTSVYTAALSTGSSVTRFMPGITAPGETEDLKDMVARLKQRGVASIQVNPGLWYEHRRDAHTIERRADGDVWAPFYEMPWARSGQGAAWDGLSKFDVSKYNPWYFEREREFAKDASEAGILVFYDLYNDHNLLEIGPHWIDFPWRPANNINDTGLPEPPPFKPHGRNDVGNEFFSTAYAPLRKLHHDYMMHTFDEMAEFPNVIFGIGYQYAGPLAFEQFFQDTAHEWEQAHPGKHIRIALTTGKQTTDAILADPVRSKQVVMVDMRYWEYEPDGTLFAPRGGENHAFRELISQAFPGYTDTPPATTPTMVYKETREYRDKYPNIALMPMEEGAGPIAILMGGAASQSALVGGRAPIPATPQQAASAMYPPRSATSGAAAVGVRGFRSEDRIIDTFVHTYLAHDLMRMSPKDNWVAAPERTWVLAGGPSEPVLIYSLCGANITLTATLPWHSYKAIWFDPRTGVAQDAQLPSTAAQAELTKPDEKDWLLLLTPEEK
jgi:hypothetical protein